MSNVTWLDVVEIQKSAVWKNQTRLFIATLSVWKGVHDCNIPNNETDNTHKANFPKPNCIYNRRHAPNINLIYMLNSCVHITTGTLVLIRLHKKADLLVRIYYDLLDRLTGN